MKPTIYTETEFKDKQVFRNEFELEDSSRYYYYNSTERIIEDKDLQNTVFEIYASLLDNYPACAKIKNIMVTFVGNDDCFICSIKFYKINHKTMKFKSSIIDWYGNNIQLKFVDKEEEIEE